MSQATINDQSHHPAPIRIDDNLTDVSTYAIEAEYCTTDGDNTMLSCHHCTSIARTDAYLLALGHAPRVRYARLIGCCINVEEVVHGLHPRHTARNLACQLTLCSSAHPPAQIDHP
jgi:hypothetical protein